MSDSWGPPADPGLPRPPAAGPGWGGPPGPGWQQPYPQQQQYPQQPYLGQVPPGGPPMPPPQPPPGRHPGTVPALLSPVVLVLSGVASIVAVLNGASALQRALYRGTRASDSAGSLVDAIGFGLLGGALWLVAFVLSVVGVVRARSAPRVVAGITLALCLITGPGALLLLVVI